MPVRSGIESTKILLSEYPDAKVIIFSAIGYREYEEQAYAAGAIGYMQKPGYRGLIEFIKKIEANSKLVEDYTCDVNPA